MNNIPESISDPNEIQRLVNEKVEMERLEYAADPDIDHKGIPFPSGDIINALRQNEDGDAWIYIETNRGHLLYDHTENLWYLWNGYYWELDILNEALRAHERVIDVFLLEAERQAVQRLQAEKSGDKQKAAELASLEKLIIARIRALQTLKRKQDILKLACAGKDSLGISGSQWDKVTNFLHCLNGKINLSDGTLIESLPTDYVRTVVPVKYLDLNTPCPAFYQFILDICGGDKELAEYLQRLFGYALTGLASENVLVVFYGPDGRNAKTTLLEIIKDVLGPMAYKTTTDIILSSKHGRSKGSADPDTLALRGKRLVSASETNHDQKFNLKAAKELTGRDTLSARGLYAKFPTEFSPTFLLIIITNDLPRVKNNDPAFWERIHTVPFKMRFVDIPRNKNEKRRDKHIKEKLLKERSGILSWMVRGAIAWREQGLNPPQCVLTATQEYRTAEDDITRFINTRCKIGDSYYVAKGALYSAYCGWCVKEGLSPLSGIKFWHEMDDRFPYDDESRIKTYQGIDLND